MAGLRFIHFAIVLHLLMSGAAWATPEYILNEQTAPSSVHETTEALEHAFRPAEPGNTLDLNLRNYYLSRERENNTDIASWAQGGQLGYLSPWWKHRLRLGAALYGSLKLYGPKDKDGAQLLKPGQESFAVLGEAYLEARLPKQITLKVYRQAFHLPYLNIHDNRMLPVTFESVSLFDTSGERFVYGLAHTWRLKQKNADKFISMTKAAGIDGHDRGVSSIAARHTFAEGSTLGLVNHYGWDYLNIFYAEINSRARLAHEIGLQFSTQFTSENSVGEEFGGNIDTHSWGVKLAASYAGQVLSLAHTVTDRSSGITNDWGGTPSYLSIILEDFDRAGEDAWLVGVSSDFSFIGQNPFSASMNYAWSDTPDHGPAASPDQSEFDLTLDYKPESGTFKGLWLRARAALLRQQGDGASDETDIRFIANYDLPLL